MRPTSTGLRAAIIFRLVALTTARASPPGSSRPSEGSSIAGALPHVNHGQAAGMMTVVSYVE